LIVWYGDANAEAEPLVVEFSFRYAGKDGDYGPKSSLRAYTAFEMLGSSAWISKGPKTKTGFVYQQANRDTGAQRETITVGR
jgi:hypothetical protein